MTIFRSEAHVDIWLDATKRHKGAVVPVSTVWRMARAWYVDPRDPNWRPRTRDENQAILSSVGLTGDFWQFA